MPEAMYNEKKRFVENELSACLKAACCGVSRLGYYRRFQIKSGKLTYTGEEYIDVHFESGGLRTVCVTGDSRLGMIKDVMKVCR